MEITGTLQKQAWVDRTTPPVEQVRPLVWSVPVTFPDAPIRYTFCYLVFNDAGECVVIDPGWHGPEGMDELAAGLAAAGSSFDAVTGIVVTHFHPDHLGLVGELRDRTGAWIAMHEGDAAVVRALKASDMALVDSSWYEKLGVPADRMDLALDIERDLSLTTMAEPTRIVEDGDQVELAGRDLRILFTPGHSPGHICVVDVDSELIFTGDHVLPRITPNVGIFARNQDEDALANYYDSLDKVVPWDAFEVCPAHEYRFIGLAERAAVLREHHEERALELLAVASANPGSTIWQIASKLTWSRGWDALVGQAMRPALAETTSHMNNLKAKGLLTWEPDPEGGPAFIVAVP